MFARIKTVMAAVAVLASATTAQADDVVKFGSIRVPVQVFVGVDKGFFAEEGIRIQTTFYKSGAEIAPAVATGQVDAAFTTSGAALFNAMARGADLTIVAEALSLEPDAPGGDPSAIVVRSDLVGAGATPTADDLRGKTIAVTAPGQILDIIVRTYLSQNGIGADEVKTIGMPMPDMVPALGSGAIDAAIVIDPFKSLVMNAGTAQVLTTSSDVLPNASQAFVVMSAAMAQNRDLAERFLRAYVKTNRWMREALTHGEGRKEIAAIYQGHVPAQDASVYENIALGTASADARVNVDGDFGLEWQLQTLVDQGLIQGDPQLSMHVDLSILDEVLASE